MLQQKYRKTVIIDFFINLFLEDKMESPDVIRWYALAHRRMAGGEIKSLCSPQLIAREAQVPTT